MGFENNIIAITGANSFIGSHLVKYFAGKDWQIRAFQRIANNRTQPNVTYYPYSLSNPVVEKNLYGAKWLVHCAYQEYNAKNKDSDRINREGTRELIRVCRRNNINIIFLSSLSAHDRAESHYGRCKLELETYFDQKLDCVLRLGLVLGEGGVFGSVLDILKKSKFIPLIDNGSQPVQVLLIDDLCKVIEKVISNKLSGRYNVGTAKVYKVKDLYEQISDKLCLKRLLIPFPLRLLQLIIGVIEFFQIPFSINSENVLGLKHMRSFDTREDLKKLDIELSTLEQSIELLL